MHLLWTILIGFVVGILARLLTSGSGPVGFFMTAILGIIGSIAATYLGQALGLYPPGHPAGFLASVVGAMILLGLYHFVTRRSA